MSKERIVEQADIPVEVGTECVGDAATRADASEAEAQAYADRAVDTSLDAEMLSARRDNDALTIPKQPSAADADSALVTRIGVDVEAGTESEAAVDTAGEEDDVAPDEADADGDSSEAAAGRGGRLLSPKEEKEFTRMYVQHRGLIAHVALAWGVNDAEVEDVVQDTFLSAARTTGKRVFDPEEGHNELAYLKRTTERMVINRHRKTQRAKEPPCVSIPEENDLGLELAERQGPSTEDTVAADDARQRKFGEWKALMPQRHFQVLVLNGYYGLSYQEVADELDVPLGTVMSSLHRAKAKIKDYEAAKSGQAPTELA